MQQMIVSYVPFYDMDERDGSLDQPEEYPGWGVFEWDGKHLGERHFVTRGRHDRAVDWLVEHGYKGNAEGVYRQ